MLERRAMSRHETGFTAPSRRIASTVAHISGLALLVVAPGLLLSALVEFIGGGDDGWILALCALI